MLKSNKVHSLTNQSTIIPKPYSAHHTALQRSADQAISTAS